MLKIGDKAEFAKKITAEMVRQFIDLTNDYNNIHSNKKSAQTVGFEDIVVQGMLYASFAGTLMWILGGNGTLLGEWQKLRFIKPVKIGDVITAKGVIKKILSSTEHYNRYRIFVTFHNQKNQNVIEPTHGIMFVPSIEGGEND